MKNNNQANDIQLSIPNKLVAKPNSLTVWPDCNSRVMCDFNLILGLELPSYPVKLSLTKMVVPFNLYPE